MKILGYKTEALFDVWSIEHLVSGICMGSIAALVYKRYELDKKKDSIIFYYAFILLIAYFWEVIEHYCEMGLINDSVTSWFRGIEFWANRIITDPLMMFLGAYIYLRNDSILRYAKVFSFLWLFFHILLFPDSMYLQDQISKLF